MTLIHNPASSFFKRALDWIHWVTFQGWEYPQPIVSKMTLCMCVCVSNNTNCNIHTIVTTHTHYSSFLWISMSTKNFTNKSQSLNRKVVNFGPTGWCLIVFIWCRCRRIRIFMKYFCTAVMWKYFCNAPKIFLYWLQNCANSIRSLSGLFR